MAREFLVKSGYAGRVHLKKRRQMNPPRFLFLCFVLLAGEGLCQSPETADKTDNAVGVRLLTRDGSCIVGTTPDEGFPVQTDLGDFKISPVLISKVVWADVAENKVQVFLRNGDKLTGLFVAPNWTMTSGFGQLSIGKGSLREIAFTNGKRSGGQTGLLFWNKMGSDAEIGESMKGPGGTRRGGRFVPGIDGNAAEAGCEEGGFIEFKDVPVKRSEGCIELWAKFSNPPFSLGAGANPFLFRLVAGGVNFDIAFTGNNGNSGAGLSGVVDCLAVAATGPMGEWTYDRAIGGSSVQQWHHFALVWSLQGLPGVSDGMQRVVVLVDGKPNSTQWMMVDSTKATADEISGPLTLMLNQHMNRGAVAFDEVRIWNYPKTDFSDEIGARALSASAEPPGQPKRVTLLDSGIVSNFVARRQMLQLENKGE
jgi:hypothetical protein